MGKCDLCQDLLEKGENPACVDACLMRCLKYGELEELRAKYGNKTLALPLPDSGITKPALVVNPSRLSMTGSNTKGTITNLREEL